MVKLLTGELLPNDGTVWKHPNMRVAYVAQHAFHHLEQVCYKTSSGSADWLQSRDTIFFLSWCSVQYLLAPGQL